MIGLVFQDNGNLLLSDVDNEEAWASNTPDTSGTDAEILVLDNEGHLRLYNYNETVAWTTSPDEGAK